MDSSSCIAQRTRAHKVRTSQVKEANRMEFKSNKMMSLNVTTKEGMKDIKMNIGPSNHYEDDNDINILGETFGGDNTSQDNTDTNEEKNYEVIFLDDSTSDEDEGKNYSKNSCVDGNKNSKMFVTKGSSSYSPEEDDEMKELETCKKEDDLLRSTLKFALHVEDEDSRGKREDGSHFKKQELDDTKRNKSFPSTSKRNVTAEANEYCHAKKVTRKTMQNATMQIESSLRKRRRYRSLKRIYEERNESQVVTVSGKNVTVEANESSHAKKVTRKTVSNPIMQVENSLKRRRYRSLKSIYEEMNESQIKHLGEKQSEDDQASGEMNKPNAEPVIEESAIKTNLNEERHDSPLNALGKKPSEEMKYIPEEESSWFAKAMSVPQKKGDFFKVLDNAILREEYVPSKEACQERAEPSSSTLVFSSLPLKFRFEDEKSEVPEKSADKNMEADMFTELECNFEYESMDTFYSNQADNKTEKASGFGSLCSEGNHDLVRTEEVGDVCRICHCVLNDIRHIPPNFAKFASRNSRKRSKENEDFLVDEGLDEYTIMNNQENFYNTDNTIWSFIPGVRETLYKHQQDGFEFLWKNLAGTTDLDELRSTKPKDVGGCIISHAPGTGKTRLSIVFVQSYLKMFPDAKPVIIAPASMLLTWEEEFRKWNVEFPFHNICNPEFSGKENKDLLKLFTMSKSQDNNKVRWVKIFSWKKGNGILGISYNLYEKLAGEKVAANGESKNLKKILLQLPKLVFLDEGHIPRNQTSSIWKTLLKLQTEKRVILSGTPFQNNFDELLNTLHLVRPEIIEKENTFKGMISTTIRYSKRPRSDNNNSVQDARTKEVDKAIEKIKEIMRPFVHVHKGGILRKSLPGLADCVILLNPQPLQKSLIETLEFSENNLELGYKVALLSVHPSLVEYIWSSDYEKIGFNLDKIKESRLDPKAGVKTRFIMELIRSSRIMNEKVLIFCQYIQPLKVIMEQLESNFGWHAGMEVLHMQGKQDQLQRQNIISIFNNPDSEAKVLLAATKCCSEGINLVGASRVVLLDVVWNPSVERQAMSRAYRLGQKKVVYTYHLITSGTNEGDKYCRQVEKDRLSELVFCYAPKDNDEQRVQAKTFEDKILEKMINDGDMKGMISKIIHTPKEANLNETFGLVDPA